MKLFVLDPDGSIILTMSDGFVKSLLAQDDTKEFFELYFVQIRRTEDQFEHACYKDCTFKMQVEDSTIEIFVRKNQIILIQK